MAEWDAAAAATLREIMRSRFVLTQREMARIFPVWCSCVVFSQIQNQVSLWCKGNFCAPLHVRSSGRIKQKDQIEFPGTTKGNLCSCRRLGRFTQNSRGTWCCSKEIPRCTWAQMSQGDSLSVCVVFPCEGNKPCKISRSKGHCRCASLWCLLWKGSQITHICSTKRASITHPKCSVLEQVELTHKGGIFVVENFFRRRKSPCYLLEETPFQWHRQCQCCGCISGILMEWSRPWVDEQSSV